MDHSKEDKGYKSLGKYKIFRASDKGYEAKKNRSLELNMRKKKPAFTARGIRGYSKKLCVGDLNKSVGKIRRPGKYSTAQITTDRAGLNAKSSIIPPSCSRLRA